MEIKSDFEAAGFKLNPSDIYTYIDIRSNASEFDKLLLDDQVAAAYSQIIQPITAADVKITPASDSQADKRAAEIVGLAIERMRFDDLTAKMAMAVHYGFSCAELVWRNHGGLLLPDAYVRDRSRFTFDGKNVYIDEKIKAQEPYFWFLAIGGQDDDRPHGYGRAMALVHLVRFKRAAHKFWLRYLDKFSQPTIIGRIPRGRENDPVFKDKLLGVLKKIANGVGVTIPEGVAVELLEATRSGTADYETFINIINKAISKSIVGQTMTTDDGSSYSQARVHGDVLQNIIDGTAGLVMESFTDVVARLITIYNVANAKPPKVERLTKPDDTLKRLEIDEKLDGLGYMPTPEYIASRYGQQYTHQQAELSQDDVDSIVTSIEPQAVVPAVNMSASIDDILAKLPDLTDELAASLFVAEGLGQHDV